MNAAICWKEYRQQRGLWVAVGVLALFLAVGIAASVGRGSGLAVFQEELVGSALVWIGYSMAVAYGLACGAVLLGAEKEDATLVFLDTLAATRQVTWEAKVASGFVLTISQGLLLAALGLGLRYLSWELALYVPLLSADALIWGLVGGALCRNVLLAVLTGMGFMAVSWVLPLAVNWMPALIVVNLTFAVLGVFLSRRIFCAPDCARRFYAQRLGLLAADGERAPKPWRVLIWLILRQGRWVLVGTAASCVPLGLAVNIAPLMCYPAATLLVGLVCGLATFVPEQSGRQQNFLGAQRLPPGRIWGHKLCFWAFAAILFTGLLWLVAVSSLLANNARAAGDRGQSAYWQENWWGAPHWWGAPLIDAPLFLGLWLVHGFCVGQFCAFWAVRPVIAAILAAVLGAALSLLWFPSVLFGGLRLWQVLGVPILLLLGTRLFFWRWQTGHLYTIRAWLGLGGISVTLVLWLVMGLWYRVEEIPDVGVPAAVLEFIAEAPTLEKSEASVLIRRASGDCNKHLAKILAEAPPHAERPGPPGLPAPAPMQPPLPGLFGPAAGGPGVGGPDLHHHQKFLSMLPDVLRDGWPKDGEDGADLARWLDKACAGNWFKDVQLAARLPLGVVQDPRNPNRAFARPSDLENMATLLSARALQLIASGSTNEALLQIETILGLARQLRNYAPAELLNIGDSLETDAFKAHRSWLANAHADKEQLRKALRILEVHEQQRPGERQARVTAYLVARTFLKNDPGKVFGGNTGQVRAINWSVWRDAWQVPWERTRQERLGDLVATFWLQEADVPYSETREFPPLFGADPWRWQRLFFRSWPVLLRTIHNEPPLRSTLWRGQILTTALVLYQAEQGKLPEKLEALVPDYLLSLPLDPCKGRSFHYRISNGETIAARPSGYEKKDFALTRGQGLVWSDGINKSPEDRATFPVPVWKRAD